MANDLAGNSNFNILYFLQESSYKLKLQLATDNFMIYQFLPINKNHI